MIIKNYKLFQYYISVTLILYLKMPPFLIKCFMVMRFRDVFCHKHVEMACLLRYDTFPVTTGCRGITVHSQL